MSANLQLVISARDNAQAALNQVRKELHSMGTNLDGISKSAQTTGRHLDGIGKSSMGAVGGVKGLVDALGKIGLAAMGIQAVGIAIAGLASPFTKSLAAASDMNESMSKVDVVFGDSADSIKKFAADSAKNMGLPSQAAMEMAGTFGNLFTSMGLTRPAAAGMSKDVLQLGADLASFNNIPVEEALLKIKSGLVGESEPLRSLGVNLTEAGVDAEVMALGLDTSTEAAKAAAKVQARYSLILKQSKNAQGDFARTSTGMANAQRIIAASFKDLQMIIGQELLPVIAPLISAFAQALPKAFEMARPLIKSFGETARGAIAGVVGLGRGVLDLVGYLDSGNKRDLMREWFGDLGPRVDEVVRFIKKIPTELGLVVAGAQNAFAGMRRAFELGSWEGVAKFIGDALAVEWGKINWGSVWTQITLGASQVGAWFGGVGASIVGWLKGVWTGIDWGATWTAIELGASTVAAWFGNAATAIKDTLTGIWASIDWAATWKAITLAEADVWRWFSNGVGAVTDWVKTVWKAIDWGAVWAGVNMAIDSLKVTVAGLQVTAKDLVISALNVKFGFDVTTDPEAEKKLADFYKKAQQKAAEDAMKGGEAAGANFGSELWKVLMSTMPKPGEGVGPGKGILAAFIYTEIEGLKTALAGSFLTEISGFLKGLLAKPLADLANSIGAAIAPSLDLASRNWSLTWNDITVATTQAGWKISTALFDLEQDVRGIGPAIEDIWNSIGPAIGDAWTLANQWLAVWKVGMDIWAREQMAPIQRVIDKWNEYKNAIAGAVGLGPQQNPNTPSFGPQPEGSVPGRNAAGTNSWRGGLTMVGEKGPEIVNLPRGAQVIPNHRIGHLAEGTGGLGSISLVQNFYGAADPAQVGQASHDGVLSAARAMGIA